MDSPESGAMFNDMFDEPEWPTHGCAPNPNSSKVDDAKMEAPPPSRGETGFCGIKNQGATCYLNSLIQTLLLTPELREELFRLGPDELGKLDDVKEKNAKVRKIPIQLQMLLARLLLLNQFTCGTEGLTESFGWVDSEELQQHDVQELSRILFCAIEDSLVGTSGHNIIKNLYRGVAANKITCLSCGKVSERTEEFLDLNVAIATRSNLNAALGDMFVETELMNGKNQYHCDNCSKLVDARKGATIKTLPPILTVSLLRFSFDNMTLRRFKETGKFEFPLALNMKPFCEHDSRGKNKCFEYDLYSVIVHSGSAHGGHYHAYIRDIDGLGMVPPDYNLTPSKTIPSSPDRSDALSSDFIDDPLELLACVLGKLGGENVPLNRLGEAFREEIGTSWVKQYKRKCGTMIKFLQSCYNHFIVDTRAKTVSLRTKTPKVGSNLQIDGAFNVDTADAPGSLLLDGSGDCLESDGSATCTIVNGHFDSQKGDADGSENAANGVVSDGFDESLDGDFHPLCNVWFDFNDSEVKPITMHDIEAKYEGRESAYMLFYRRKDLKRPLESLGNMIGGIPDHIRAKVQEENCNLEELRTEYDSFLNVVTLRVFFPTMFKRESGLIKFADCGGKDSSSCGFSYSIDRRKTVSDMTAELIQMAEKHEEDALLSSRKKLQCNVLKGLDHGGVHVYDRVDVDAGVVIGKSILENGQQLLAWDGSELHGLKITPGVANEPIVLTIQCEICGGSNIMSFEFKGVSYGNVVLADLQNYFHEKFKMKNVTSSRIGRRGGDGELVPFSDEQPKHWLGDVVKSTAENLLIELTLDEAESDMMHTDDSDVSTLHISPGEAFQAKLLEVGYFGSPHDVFVLTSVSGSMKVGSYVFVSHLKAMILQWLFPELKRDYSHDTLHLYVERDRTFDCVVAPKLCLHEQQSLAQAGLIDGTPSVKLEFGKPPDKKELHVTVYVQKGSKLKLPVKKCQAVQETCIKTHTVASFISKITSEQGLLDNSRYLRLLKSEKEVGEIIANADLAIEKTLIKHGSTLVLCPGSISCDGQLRVPVLFYPRLPSFEDVKIRIRDNPTLSAWISFLNEEETRSVPIGHVEIKKDATLFELKREIVKLDYFQNEDMTNFEGICLRSVSHRLPTRFHLQETSSVKRLRLGPSTPLAVQKSSTIPADNYTLLHVSFQTPGTRLYVNSCGMEWEKSTPLAQMYGELSKSLGVSTKEILIAKRGEESWDWEIVKARDSDLKAKDAKSIGKAKKGSKQKKSQGKAKKKPTGKTLVLPQDGDVLRVKNIFSPVEGSPEITDFKSEEEVTAWKRWKDSRQRDSNLQTTDDTAQTDSAPTSEEKKKIARPKKEESLRIHVDKF